MCVCVCVCNRYVGGFSVAAEKKTVVGILKIFLKLVFCFFVEFLFFFLFVLLLVCTASLAGRLTQL